MSQSPNQVLMIRPAHFGFNSQTAGNNAFQKETAEEEDISKKAKEEFDAMVAQMINQDIIVHVIQDSDSPIKPDAVFPNNWLSTHTENTICTWPMYAKNRRTERRKEITDHLREMFEVKHHERFEHFEQNNIFLEGTGSMVLDRINKVVYACLSDRTYQLSIENFCHKFGYTAKVFHAVDQEGTAIYHTNVLMAIGTEVAVVCTESILEESKEEVLNSLRENGKDIVDISFEQLKSYAGNMLEVKDTHGKKYMLMSSTAFNSLNQDQIALIENSCEILHFDISTIETAGGGSVRCMLCEVFLDLKKTTDLPF